MFRNEYRLDDSRVHDRATERADGTVALQAQARIGATTAEVRGEGNGPIDAFCKGVSRATSEGVRALGYHEHSVGSGADAQAIAYVELRLGDRTLFGVGQDRNIVTASLKAIVSGLQRAGVRLAMVARAQG